jgi:cyanophycin synthetase
VRKLPFGIGSLFFEVQKLSCSLARSCRRRRYQQEFWIPGLSEFEMRLAHGLWQDAARRCGLQSRYEGPLLIISSANGEPIVSIHGHAVSIESLSAYFVCGDKVLTNALLRSARINVPEGNCFRSGDPDQALRYAQGMNRPCAVKPARGTSASFGVSLNLSGEQKTRAAFKEAALFCEDVLVEEFVRGDPYRFLVYRGKCLSATCRSVASVVGNGRDPVRVLVERENANRLKGFSWSPGQSALMAIPADERAAKVLKRQELTWESVPANGQPVQMFDKSEYQFGASYREALGETHPGTIAAIERAATAVGSKLAGVDVISADLAGGHYCINEVNTTPGIWIHYCVADDPRDPLATILSSEASRKARRDFQDSTEHPWELQEK